MGIDVFLTPAFGVEAWVAHDTLSPDGTSSTYDTSLRYVSRPPPSYDPIVVDYERSTEWPAVASSLARWTTALNGVLRWGAPSAPVGATISAGGAGADLRTSFEPLGYTMFVLGGHSTLFPNEYRLETAMVPSTVVRGNVGGSIDVHLGRRASLSLGLRQVLGPDAVTPAARSSRSIDRRPASTRPASTRSRRSSPARRPTMETASFKLTVGLKVEF